MGGGTQQPAQWTDSRGRDSACPQTPLTTVEGTPPGDALRHPHSEQRRPARAHAVRPLLGPHARTDRTRDTRVGEPWLPAPEDGRPGEGQRLTPDAPHNGGRPPPPGDGPPPPPRHAAPTGHAGQGDSVGPPHPNTRAHSTWVADPNSPPSGRAVGGGTAPDLRRPSQWWKAPPPGTPFRHPHSEQRRPARAHAVVPVLGPHARTDRTRDTWVAEPRLPASEDGRPGEGQRLTPDAPHNGARHPPLGTPFRHPHSEQRRPARAHASGPVLGPHARTDRTRDTRVAEPWLPAPEDGRPGEGQRLTPDAPHNGGRPPPRGRPPATPAARSPHRAYATNPPNGGRTAPSQVGGNRDQTALPEAHQTQQGTGARHAEGHGPRGTALTAPSAGTARGARATPPRGGGADAAGARAHTHVKGTRGLPDGQPDRDRGTHRPRGMAYQRARIRDTGTGRPATRSAGHAGREGGNGRDTTPGTSPSPPNRPRGPRTHGRGTAAAKAVVAHCATPQPLG